MDLKSFLQNLKWESLDEQTRQSAKRCTLDVSGCALVGSAASRFNDLAGGFASTAKTALPIWWGTL